MQRKDGPKQMAYNILKLPHAGSILLTIPFFPEIHVLDVRVKN